MKEDDQNPVLFTLGSAGLTRAIIVNLLQSQLKKHGEKKHNFKMAELMFIITKLLLPGRVDESLLWGDQATAILCILMLQLEILFIFYIRSHNAATGFDRIVVLHQGRQCRQPSLRFLESSAFC